MQNWFKSTLPDETIARIRFVADAFCLPITVAFSGGKDSIVLLDLVRKSGIMHRAIFNLTTIDPPEIVYFVRNEYPDVTIERPKYSIWQLIVKKRMPPTRGVRYCCQILKERKRFGLTLTGIRSEESVSRKGRNRIETMAKNRLLYHPILGWSENGIWEYIEANGLKYPAMYDNGHRRIGCIGCPCATVKERQMDFEVFPKYKIAYIRAFDKALKRREAGRYKNEFKDGQEMFDWWMSQ